MKSITILIVLSFGVSLGSYSANAPSTQPATLLKSNTILRASNTVESNNVKKTTERIGKRVIKKL